MATIGEFFVNLGVKGSEKTLGALKNTKLGLKETASYALEARVALIGAMYAFERLMSASGKAGTSLTNFNETTGVAMKTLQQYQFAARQVGVSNEEVEGSFKTLQATMSKTLMGEGAPKGLARVAQLTGGMTAQDVKKFAEQPQLALQKLQEYAGKETNKGLRSEVLKSFGMSEGMIAALGRQAFTPKQLAKAPTYSDSQIKNLDEANIGWSNLGNKIEMAFGKFNAKHGKELVKDISDITDKVIGLADAFVTLAEKLKLFKGINKAFEGWALIFEGLAKSVDTVQEHMDAPGESKITEAGQAPKDADMMGRFVAALFTGLAPGGPGLLSALASSLEGESPKSGLRLVPPPSGADSKTIAPPQGPVSRGVGTPTQNVNVNQTLNFQHDGRDSKRTGDSVKKAVQDTYRQLGAQSQGS